MLESFFQIIGNYASTIGLIFTAWQLWQGTKVRRVQLISSFNERLGKCNKANYWILNSQSVTTGDDTSLDMQTYIATFEDIGLARRANVLKRSDFLRSYGGRYKTLISSKALERYKETSEYDGRYFYNLEILNRDLRLIDYYLSTNRGFIAIFVADRMPYSVLS